MKLNQSPKKMKLSLLLSQKNILYIILIQVLLGLFSVMLLVSSSLVESKDLKARKAKKEIVVSKVLKVSKVLVVFKVHKVIAVIAVNKVQKVIRV